MADITVRGVSRGGMAADGREIHVYFDRVPSDDDMRLVHDVLRDGLARGDAYRGAREDLEIWKKRALEAEATLDKMWRQHNAENGPTHFGEPVLGA